jgi:hypothetical protein
VRLELLPLLQKRQPAVDRTILRAMQITGADADFVTQMAEAWLNSVELMEARRRAGNGIQRFASLHVAVQRCVIQSQVRALGVEADFQMVEQLRTHPGRAVSVGPEIDLIRDEAGMVKRAETESEGFIGGHAVVEIGKSVSSRWRLHTFGGVRLEVRVVRRRRDFSYQQSAGRELFDAGKAGSRLRFRHWQAGDRFRPIGLSAAVKLQDWFTNRKVPAALRRKRVMAETERGELFWVEGERIGELCKVTPATRRLLELRWKRV